MIKLAKNILTKGFTKVFNFLNYFPWQVKFVAVVAYIIFPINYVNDPVGTSVLFRNFMKELACQRSAMIVAFKRVCSRSSICRSYYYTACAAA
jgi:hypothetical protein